MSRHKVSDHALLRYFERVHGLDIDWFREQLTSKNLEAAIKMGASKFIEDGIEYRMRGGVVTTLVVTDLAAAQQKITMLDTEKDL